MTTTITPHADAKYTPGQEVYWGARLCTIHDIVPTTGTGTYYLVAVPSEGGTAVVNRPVHEGELLAVRAQECTPTTANLPAGGQDPTFGPCDTMTIDELHAFALKINPRGIVTEISAGPDGIHTRIVAPRMHPCTPKKCVFPDGDPACPLC
jgi:hypothetical protein